MTFVTSNEVNDITSKHYSQLAVIQIVTLLIMFALAVFYWWDTNKYIILNAQLIQQNAQLIEANKALAQENREFLVRLSNDLEVLKKNAASKRTK